MYIFIGLQKIESDYQGWGAGAAWEKKSGAGAANK